MFRSLAPHQVVVDALLGTSAVLLRLALGPINSAHVVVVVLMGLAFVLHRLSPGLALGVAWLGALLQVFAVLPPDLANLAILVVLYSTARHGQGIVRWLGLASAGAGALVVALYLLALSIFPFGLPDGDFLGFSFSRIGQYALAFTFSFIVTIATLGLSWTLGQLVRVADRARESSLQQRIAERTAELTERTGQLDEILDKLANFYTREADNKLKHFFNFFDEEFISHNRREEATVFPLLRERLLSSGEHGVGDDPATAIDRMEDEHTKAAQLAAVILNFLGLAFRFPEEKTKLTILDAAIEQCQFLIELLRLHVFREDNVVIPLAHRLISRSELDEMQPKAAIDKILS